MEKEGSREKPEEEGLARQEETARRFRARAEKGSRSEGLALLDLIDRPSTRG
jgi:hypothetical protein